MSVPATSRCSAARNGGRCRTVTPCGGGAQSELRHARARASTEWRPRRRRPGRARATSLEVGQRAEDPAGLRTVGRLALSSSRNPTGSSPNERDPVQVAGQREAGLAGPDARGSAAGFAWRGCRSRGDSFRSPVMEIPWWAMSAIARLQTGRPGRLSAGDRSGATAVGRRARPPRTGRPGGTRTAWLKYVRWWTGMKCTEVPMPRSASPAITSSRRCRLGAPGSGTGARRGVPCSGSGRCGSRRPRKPASCASYRAGDLRPAALPGREVAELRPADRRLEVGQVGLEAGLVDVVPPARRPGR